MQSFEDDNPPDLNVIRRKLAGLKKNGAGYRLDIGHYVLRIFPTLDYEESNPHEDNILKYEVVDVDLYEAIPTGDLEHQNIRRLFLREDVLFCNYEPIQYNYFTGSNGRVNLSDGNKMPISYLCELIKYLHRLSNLTAFM